LALLWRGVLRGEERVAFAAEVRNRLRRVGGRS